GTVVRRDSRQFSSCNGDRLRLPVEDDVVGWTGVNWTGLPFGGGSAGKRRQALRGKRGGMTYEVDLAVEEDGDVRRGLEGGKPRGDGRIPCISIYLTAAGSLSGITTLFL
ncbi:MAG: hypothetical protein BJ554DRAFT_2907, partial [Olpidium bornovanus]